MIVYDLENIKHLKNNNLNPGYFVNGTDQLIGVNYIINHIEKN